MTDEEIVKRAKEAEKRTGFGELVHSPISKGVNSAYGIGFIEGMVEYRNSLHEEPVKDRFAFKAIPRLLEMIEPTDKAKSYVTKLADAFDSEGYYTDAKIVRNRLKIMNDEKVSMATMDDEPVSEELENAAFDYAEACKYEGGEKLLCVEHFKGGANWKEEQIEEVLLSEVLPCFMHDGEADEVMAKLDEVLSKKK